MTQLADLIKTALIETGDNEKKATTVAERIIMWGAGNDIAGKKYYWPCQFRLLTAQERAAMILADFNGNNLNAVCKKHNVKPNTVYRIIRG
mgnify:CR=1 FL=1